MGADIVHADKPAVVRQQVVQLLKHKVQAGNVVGGRKVEHEVKVADGELVYVDVVLDIGRVVAAGGGFGVGLVHKRLHKVGAHRRQQDALVHHFALHPAVARVDDQGPAKGHAPMHLEHVLVPMRVDVAGGAPVKNFAFDARHVVPIILDAVIDATIDVGRLDVGRRGRGHRTWALSARRTR